MFQLLTAVISVALVSALSIATLYYGGTVFRTAMLEAYVVGMVNAAQQVSGAQIIYASDHGGTFASDISDLKALGPSGTYIASFLHAINEVANAPPPLQTWTITSLGAYVYFVVDEPSIELTNAVNARAGNEAWPRFGVSHDTSSIGSKVTGASASVFWYRL